MEAKIKHNGLKIMVQTSSVTMCYFKNLQVYNSIDFALEVSSMFAPPTTRNLDPTN